MKPFDPGGAPHALADGHPMAYYHSHKASSCEFGSAQLCVRREFFCPRGLKEGIFLEDAEKRVLHSTYRATLYLTARIAPVSPSQGPSNNAHFPFVPRNAEQIIHPRRNINASDGSFCILEDVAGSMEGKGLIPVDCLSRVHNKVQRIMGGSNVQLEQENSSDVPTSFDDSLTLSSHQESSLLSKSLQNSYDSASSKLTSLQTFHIPRASALHISCDAMWQVSEFCIEDPEAPSTPDLQPEVRSWDCVALCTIGADQMLPADNLCPSGANDSLPVNSKDADDMLLLEEEDITSTCIVQCPTGATKSFHALMKQVEDTYEDYSSLSDPSYKCSSSSLCDYKESANSKHARKLDSSACRQYMVQRLFYCLMISALSICATPNNKKSHSQFLHALRSFQRLIRLLRLNCEGEDMCEQLLADIQIYLLVYKPRHIPDHEQKAMEVRPAACYSNKQLVHKQVHSMVNEYAGDHQKVVIVQEQVLVMLQVFSQRHLVRRSGNRFGLRCLYLEQGNVGSCELNQCSSTSSSKLGIVSASKSSNLLEIEDGKLPRSTEPSGEMMNDFEEDFTVSHGSSFRSQENGLTRRIEELDDWNSIPIDQVGECLDTCLLHLQARPSAFPSDLTSHLKRADLSVVSNQSEGSNIKCSNDRIIDEGHQDYLVCTKDNRHEASCLPMSAVDGPCSLTLSQCGLSVGLSMEELRSSLLYGGVHERQSREKLEHFAEGFLLRRHIIQQQRRAQQAPPYPCRESAGLVADEKGSASTELHSGVKPSPYTYTSTNARMKSSENRNHEPTMILTSSLTKPCDLTSSFCDHDNFVGADVVIDIVGLVKYLESDSNQLETLTDEAVNSMGCTHMPSTGGQLVIPNVSAVIVTIVAIVVYTKILLEGAFAWVGSRTHSKEEN